MCTLHLSFHLAEWALTITADVKAVVAVQGSVFGVIAFHTVTELDVMHKVNSHFIRERSNIGTVKVGKINHGNTSFE
jgi:hypothetical protein